MFIKVLQHLRLRKAAPGIYLHRIYYDAVRATLGVGQPLRHKADSGHARLIYRHDSGTFCVSGSVNGEVALVGDGNPIGFKCESPEQLRESHGSVVAHGGTSIEEAPRLRNGTSGAMYLAYVRDPDSNKRCAIFRAK